MQLLNCSARDHPSRHGVGHAKTRPMNEETTQRLSRDEISALKFAAHRQLARWAKRGHLRPRQREQRSALVRAVRILERPALTDGCELRAFSEK
jgi:hypothetical protein